MSTQSTTQTEGKDAESERKLGVLYDALRTADDSTRDSVSRYLAAKQDRNDDEIVVLADIPNELQGRRIVMATRAQAEPMSFKVTPSTAEGNAMVVDFGAGPDEPMAISYSPTASSETALYQLYAEGGGRLTTAPNVVREMLHAAIDSAAQHGARSVSSNVAVLERPADTLVMTPEQEMRERIARARQEIFDAGYSTTDVATELHVKTGEAVRQRLVRKELLGIKINRDYRFPRWQFDPTAPNGVLPGLDQVLSAARLSSLELASWFETPQTALGGRTPVDALRRGEVEAVAAAAAAAGAV